MKKVSSVIAEKNIYELEILIRNTALMKSVTGKTGLINIKTNKIVGSFDNFYHNIYNSDDNFYFQEKEVEGEGKGYFASKVYVRIYDTLYEKMVADNWLAIKSGIYYNIAILQNPYTQKYHLFQEHQYRTPLSIFENGYDDIQELYNDNNYLKITKDGKKAIYSTKKGFITPFEYDDIERIGDATIFTQGKYKFFTCLKDSKENEIKSPLFEEISCDKKDSSLFFCKRNNITAIYYIKKCYCRLLFTAPVCDDINCVNIIDRTNYYEPASEYVFLVQKDNKYGLLSGVVDNDEKNEVPCQSLVNIEYDGIEYKSGDYFLNKNGKQGIFTRNFNSSYLIDDKNDKTIPICDKYLIEAKYDKVIPVYNSYFYELFNGENCNIVILANNIQSQVISDCKIIENIGSAVIFEKNGFKGIFWVLKEDKHLILDNYDDVEYLGYGYYIITKNGKKGIIHGTKIIIEPKYESIEINGYSGFENLSALYCADTLYFALKIENGQYELAKYKKGQYSWDKNELQYLNGKCFNDIKLYNHIMVFRDQNNAYVYSYDENLLKTFPLTVEISTTTITKGKEEIILYLVDGVYYMYKDQKFEEAPIEDCELYVTTYESEHGTVVVNSYDKQKHDEICKQIEDGGDENFDNTLISIQEKYPKLVKKLSPNKNNPNS